STCPTEASIEGTLWRFSGSDDSSGHEKLAAASAPRDQPQEAQIGKSRCLILSAFELGATPCAQAERVGVDVWIPVSGLTRGRRNIVNPWGNPFGVPASAGFRPRQAAIIRSAGGEEGGLDSITATAMFAKK
ncbi:MAG: hypothetical protein WCL16_14645, partial [bacterium]